MCNLPFLLLIFAFFFFFHYSPIGEVFRARMRQFPSLVTCCTIDWFSTWPEEALLAVATSFLSEIPQVEANPTAMRGLVRILDFVSMHVDKARKHYVQSICNKNKTL